MKGEPIPGTHWLSIDLGEPTLPLRVLIDWENAFSNDWLIEVSMNSIEHIIEYTTYLSFQPLIT